MYLLSFLFRINFSITIDKLCFLISPQKHKNLYLSNTANGTDKIFLKSQMTNRQSRLIINIWTLKLICWYTLYICNKRGKSVAKIYPQKIVSINATVKKTDSASKFSWTENEVSQTKKKRESKKKPEQRTDCWIVEGRGLPKADFISCYLV